MNRGKLLNLYKVWGGKICNLEFKKIIFDIKNKTKSKR